MKKVQAHVPSIPAQAVPRGYWKEKSNHIEFVNQLVTKLYNPQGYDDYYKLQIRDFDKNHGGRLISLYNNSVYNLLTNLYPQHEWIPWNFSSVPRNFWNNIENQKKYFKWLEKQLGIEKLEDWYNIPVHKLKQKDTIKNGLVKGHYGDSLYQALSKVYPHYHWIPWKFQSSPRNFWKIRDNRRAYFDWLSKELQINTLDDWYNIDTDTIRKHYGGGLLQNVYNNSLYDALLDVYPQHKWESWKFSRIPRGIRNKPELVYQLLQRAANSLDITTLDDWYRVSVPHLRKLKLLSLVKHYGSLPNLLVTFYPHHRWDSSKFKLASLKKSQRWLCVLIKRLFPQQVVHENYIHRSLIFSSGRPMELDVFLPDLNVAFEYQGKQHYEDIQYFGPKHTYASRDSEKRDKCGEAGITLIEVHYSWDNTIQGLISIIKTQAPLLESKINLQASHVP